MINLITGLPGSGKSLFTLKTVKELADKDNRPVFYNGIPELTLDWQLLETGEQWIDCPEGAIIVIDECQTTFRPRANGSLVPKHVQQLEVHRHDGHDLFLITQHPMLLDGNLRRLVGRHYHVNRFFGFQKATIHEFQKVRDNVDKSTKGSTEKLFAFPKEVYGWYKSADLHTVKRRIPPALIAVVVLPLLLIGAIYMLYSSVDSLGNSGDTIKELSGTDSTAQTSSSGTQTITQRQKQPVYNYFEAMAERVAGLPHTAPAYDEVTKPVEAPIPAACVDFKGECKCYTQQGTRMQTPTDMCRQIVERGFFVDFENGDALQTRQRQTEPQSPTLERVVSEAPISITDRGEKVAAGSVDLPVEQEQRSPSKITRERMNASQWAFKPPV